MTAQKINILAFMPLSCKIKLSSYEGVVNYVIVTISKSFKTFCKFGKLAMFIVIVEYVQTNLL